MRSDKLNSPDVSASDAQCLKIILLQFSGHMLNRTEKRRKEVISLNPEAAAILFSVATLFSSTRIHLSLSLQYPSMVNALVPSDKTNQSAARLNSPHTPYPHNLGLFSW